MHHRKKVKSLGRVANKRKALMRSLVVSLVKSGKIKTTLTKAKVLRPYIERIISQSRHKGIATIRNLRREFNQETVDLLMQKWAPIFKERKGGYIRINKLVARISDASPMAFIEFVERPIELAANKDKLKVKATKKTKVDKPKAKLNE